MDSQAEACTGVDEDAASQFKAWACSPQQLDGSPELACGPLELSPVAMATTQARSCFAPVVHHLMYLTCLLLELWRYLSPCACSSRPALPGPLKTSWIAVSNHNTDNNPVFIANGGTGSNLSNLEVVERLCLLVSPRSDRPTWRDRRPFH